MSGTVDEQTDDPGLRALRCGARMLDLVARAALVALLIAGLLLFQAESSYDVPAGSVAFQLKPAWPGGRLIMPLGPAGELSLRTHRTPVDVLMTYRLPSQTAALLDENGSARDVQQLEGGAQAAFTRYLQSRIPWLVLIGAAAGLLVAGAWTRRRLVWAGVAGVVVALSIGGAVAAVSYSTLDRTPSVEYRGLATKVPEILPLLRALSTGGDQGDSLSRLHDFFDGLEAVAAQLQLEPRRPVRADVVRFLLASDIHDNVFGARAVARLAVADGSPVDAVLLAGDITDRGTGEEARLFVRVFGRTDAPVLVVGGNHEDEPAVRVFADAGYQVLDGSATTIAGVTVLGASDPVARSSRVASDLDGLATSGAWLATLWELADPEPQILLVHDIRQALATIDAAEEADRDLLVAYGNDHVAGLRRQGSVVLVDAGTAGASGYESIGSADERQVAEPAAGSRDVYTFQLVDFSRAGTPHLVGVTTLSYSGDGRTVVSYTPFGP